MNKSEYTMRPIACIHTDYREKFGIPRQSGLVPSKATITFYPPCANADYVRGLEQFSHIWLLWYFSEHAGAPLHATVRPPRLGGNTRVGVFASRSPFRPNPIGLSCVSLLSVEMVPETGPVLTVSGADLLDGTPILDIKPYLPYADCIPDAAGGYAEKQKAHLLDVQVPEECEKYFSCDSLTTVRELLRQDPRPSYQDDPQRIYGLRFADKNIRFRIENNTVYVLEVIRNDP